jgi:tetratricopeptide (TPR) repeat protein
MNTASTEVPSSLSQFLEKRLEANPFSPSFSHLASIYLGEDRPQEARTLCEKGITQYPLYATGHLVLGQCYLRLRKFGDARREFSETLNLQPQCEVARMSLRETVLASAAGSAIEAATAEDRIQASPWQPMHEEHEVISWAAADEIVTSTLAEIYASQGAYQEAIRTYTLLARRRPQEREHFERRIRELEEIWRSLRPPS